VIVRKYRGRDMVDSEHIKFEINSYPPCIREQRPTAEQQSRIDKLTDDHLRLIDRAILANASSQWRKVARVIGSAMLTTVDYVART